MSEEFLEVFSSNIKNYIVSQKACKFDGNNYILESRFGKLSLDFSDEKLDKVILHAKRCSGSGKFIVECDGVKTVYSTLSKISQSIDLGKINKFNILRDDCIGELAIFGFTIFYKSDEAVSELNNWKIILKKCDSYSAIRLINDKLFASVGAVIDSKYIQNVETDPPGACILSGDKAKFSISCEITNLTLSHEAQIKQPIQMYTHRAKPTPVIIQPNNLQHRPDLTISEPYQFKSLLKSTNNNPVVIYDSLDNRGFTKLSGFNKLVKLHNSGGKDFISIARGGILNISNSALRPNTEYYIIIDIKKLSGNGRVKLSLANNNDNPLYFETINASSKECEKHITLKTGAQGDQNYKLQIFMTGDDCSGEVIFSRIRISATKWEHEYIEYHDNNNDNVYNYSPSSYKKKFVIVIPSYKNIDYCVQNIISTINQNYDNYRVIFTDDCSPDGTFEKVSGVVASSNKQNKFTLIKNTKRIGALENLYNMIHSCDDDEIILTLDGDDWLAHDNVLNKVNAVYNSGEVWMTYGQYRNSNDGGNGVAEQIPDSVIRNNSFRQYKWCATHLRTFYTWLFKCVKKEDLMYNGKFAASAWDIGFQMPQLELCGHRSRFINEQLYIYNLDNPINDHKVDKQLQQNLDRYFRKLPKYTPLARTKLKQKTLGLIVIATGKYDEFVQGLISSADNYFFKNDPDINVTYYVFGDKQFPIISKRSIVNIQIDHRPFPFASMDRFKHFVNNAELLSSQDYIYYVDVDSLFVDYVGKEILTSGTCGVTHCGFVNIKGPVETNPKSTSYFNETEKQNHKRYYGGGMSGGVTKNYLALAKWCNDMIEIDLSKNVIPVFHDESILNRYFFENEPEVVLDCGYHFPQSNKTHYQRIWGNKTFKPKILLLDKNHKEIRS